MPTKKRNPEQHPDLESVMFTEAQIKKRVRELGREIREVYGGGEFTIISIINGAVMFTADLMREIDNPVRLDCVRISSYGNQDELGGDAPDRQQPDDRHREAPRAADRRHPRHGQDDHARLGLIMKLGPASLRTCVLLDKVGRREVPFDADFVGFKIPDKFVIGYGLDFAERYRNLPCIGVLSPRLQNPPEWA